MNIGKIKMSNRGIGERSGNSHSVRAAKGKLDVIESKCPYCGNNKAFVNKTMKRKCTKCRGRY